MSIGTCDHIAQRVVSGTIIAIPSVCRFALLISNQNQYCDENWQGAANEDKRIVPRRG